MKALRGRTALVPSHPLEKTWPLGVVDIALRDMRVGMVCLYEGQIEPDRFLGAAEAALRIYDFWYGRLVERGSDVLLECRSRAPNGVANGNGYVPVTVSSTRDALNLSDRAALFNNDLLTRLLPNAFEPRPRPLLEIKLTTFGNATALAVVWNHAVCDLKGTYNTIDLISRIYNDERPAGELLPTFERSAIWGKLSLDMVGEKKSFERHNRNGTIVVSRRLATLAIPRYLFHAMTNYVPICLFMDDGEVESLVQRGGAREKNLSSNDILNATLLQLFGECSERRTESGKVGLYFPIDLRALLGVSPRTVANCLGNVSGSVDISQIRDGDLLDLAAESRRLVNEYGLPQLVEDLTWAEHWRRQGAGRRLYHRWLFGRQRVYSSNWATFNLGRSHFGDAAFRSVLRSSRFKRSLPFPAFHSTILPHAGSDSNGSAIRTTIPKSGLSRLKEALPRWPHVGAVVRLDTMERIDR